MPCVAFQTVLSGICGGLGTQPPVAERAALWAPGRAEAEGAVCAGQRRSQVPVPGPPAAPRWGCGLLCLDWVAGFLLFDFLGVFLFVLFCSLCLFMYFKDLSL